MTFLVAGEKELNAIMVDMGHNSQGNECSFTRFRISYFSERFFDVWTACDSNLEVLKPRQIHFKNWPSLTHKQGNRKFPQSRHEVGRKPSNLLSTYCVRSADLQCFIWWGMFPHRIKDCQSKETDWYLRDLMLLAAALPISREASRLVHATSVVQTLGYSNRSVSHKPSDFTAGKGN